jgi:hypothetical protein
MHSTSVFGCQMCYPMVSDTHKPITYFLLTETDRLSNEEKDIPEKSKQASSVVNLILPEVRLSSSL